MILQNISPTNNNSTVLRPQNGGVVCIFPAATLTGKMPGESKGGRPPLAHDFRRKSSVLYLLSRLARERGGAVWRGRFPAAENQPRGWSRSTIPWADFGRDKRYIQPPSLVLRPAAAMLPTGRSLACGQPARVQMRGCSLGAGIICPWKIFKQREHPALELCQLLRR